jgi:hypothetical protein
MKNNLFLVFILIVLLTPHLAAQNASYLDSVYQSQQEQQVQYEEQENEEETEAQQIEAIKQEIYDSYQIVVIDDQQVNKWGKSWITAVKEVLAAVPENFRNATRIISLDPGYLQYEVKYNGFDQREGEILMGYGSMMPSNIYLNAFNSTYNRLPSDSEKIARFKAILIRGMTYAFIQANPEVATNWSQVYRSGEIKTKVYGPGQDQNMVVLPRMSPAMVDMAFSVMMYCSAPSNLKSKSSARYDFIKEYVMDGQTIGGWGSTTVDEDENGGNSGNTGNTGSVETPGSRPPPEIPDGDYMPIVTEADVGTAAATIPQEQHTAPAELKNAIVEVFADMPKFFSTCTEAIVYLPTTDTEAAFSSEGYIFLTQNSWFAPSFVELTDESRAARFKRFLVREMTKRFLYFHPEVSQKWQETFVPNQTMYDVYVDICEAMMLYYQNKDWFRDLNNERFNFIKSELMQGKEF